MATSKITSPVEAGERIAAGQIVAIPTETVYGLAGNACSASAIEAIFRAKGRPADNPLILHLATPEDWRVAAASLPESAAILLEEFAPGPITVVVPRSPNICELATAGLSTVGIRIPSNGIARAVIEASRVPIAAPSANLSGRPSCTTWESVLEDLDGRIDAVLCADPTDIGVESTVVDCSVDPPVLLRAGAVTLEQIQRLFPNASAAIGDGRSTECGRSKRVVRSPGVAHPHYQPEARVELFSTIAELERLVQPADTGQRVAVCYLQNASQGNLSAALTELRLDGLILRREYPSIADYCSGYYEFLREADRRGAQLIAVHQVEDQGLGSALADRQRRSAGL